MTNITIAGRQFAVTPRYSAGHTLTENEANALNQVLFENLRNNFAAKAKEGQTQEQFDEYAASYQFGVRTGGGSRQDPVQAEAMSIARDQIKAVIRKAGKNLSEFKAAAITVAAEKLLASDKGAEILEIARKRVAEVQAAGQTEIDADLLSALTTANEEPAASSDETTAEEKPAKGKK